VAEAWGAIERFLGVVLNGIYQVIPSWGVAIIVLTLLVRFVLIPVTVKQIRSMTSMQKIQPELKKLQQKYKGDRQKLNEEMMKLYREHGVNPLGGCAPLLMQAPAFIALYSVLRAAILFDVALPAEVPTQFTYDRLTVCRPVGERAPTGPGSTAIECRRGNKTQTIEINRAMQRKLLNAKPLETLPSYVSTCAPHVMAKTKSKPQRIAKDPAFRCASPFGSGHVPRSGSLFKDIVRGKSTFLGMRLGCSPQQSTNKVSFQQCSGTAGTAGASVVGYFALVLLMMGSTYYQQKQMSSQATGPQAKQMQTMGRVMPLFLGFISLNIPTGVIIYWIVSNVWTIGQQYFFLQRQPTTGPPSAGAAGKGDGPPKGKPPMKPQPKPKPKRRR
jgi:YidC/Oxa1 family membrane protein insertase